MWCTTALSAPLTAARSTIDEQPRVRSIDILLEDLSEDVSEQFAKQHLWVAFHDVPTATAL